MERNPDYVNFYEPRNGHTWYTKTCDDFIVGRLHGHYTIEQCLLYITYTNQTLANLTAAELETFWNVDLMNPRYQHVCYWAEIHPEDPRVQEVLNRIRALLLEVQGIVQ